MKCPKCKFEWKDKRMVDGGKKSRRELTTIDQAKMQEARKLKKLRLSEVKRQDKHLDKKGGTVDNKQG